MKKIFASLMAFFLAFCALAHDSYQEESLSLEEAASFFGDGAHYGGANGGYYYGGKDGAYDPRYNVGPYFSRYYGQNLGISDRYGRGGYGDPNYQGFNLSVCNSTTVDLQNCMSHDPDALNLEWRFIKNLGWRKFNRYGAARKDWWSFKKNFNYWPTPRNAYARRASDFY
ncbi:MAG TPA: hypothetical protein VEL47_03735 [Myxococcota bacterium]|nr:hypothetical protein [Myxococcota bacterium]